MELQINNSVSPVEATSSNIPENISQSVGASFNTIGSLTIDVRPETSSNPDLNPSDLTTVNVPSAISDTNWLTQSSKLPSATDDDFTFYYPSFLDAAGGDDVVKSDLRIQPNFTGIAQQTTPRGYVPRGEFNMEDVKQALPSLQQPFDIETDQGYHLKPNFPQYINNSIDQRDFHATYGRQPMNGYGPSRHGDYPNGGGGGYRYGGSREGMGGGGLHGSAHGSPRHGQPNGFPTSNVVSNPDGFVYKVQFKHTHRNFLRSSFVEGAIEPGDFVVVEADRGEDLGVVCEVQPMPTFFREGGSLYSKEKMTPFGMPEPRSGVKHILRHAQAHEYSLLPVKMAEEQSIVEVCRERALGVYLLPMTVNDAEYQFDRHKLTIFYESQSRIDFRELVRDMFAVYKTRIWMEHVSYSFRPHEGAARALATGDPLAFHGGSGVAVVPTAGAAGSVVAAVRPVLPTPTIPPLPQSRVSHGPHSPHGGAPPVGYGQQPQGVQYHPRGPPHSPSHRNHGSPQYPGPGSHDPYGHEHGSYYPPHQQPYGDGDGGMGGSLRGHDEYGYGPYGPEPTAGHGYGHGGNGHGYGGRGHGHGGYGRGRGRGRGGYGGDSPRGGYGGGGYGGGGYNGGYGGGGGGGQADGYFGYAQGTGEVYGRGGGGHSGAGYFAGGYEDSTLSAAGYQPYPDQYGSPQEQHSPSFQQAGSPYPDTFTPVNVAGVVGAPSAGEFGAVPGPPTLELRTSPTARFSPPGGSRGPTPTAGDGSILAGLPHQDSSYDYNSSYPPGSGPDARPNLRQTPYIDTLGVISHEGLVSPSLRYSPHADGSLESVHSTGSPAKPSSLQPSSTPTSGAAGNVSPSGTGSSGWDAGAALWVGVGDQERV